LFKSLVLFRHLLLEGVLSNFDHGATANSQNLKVQWFIRM
jgi:hypothetical protein